MPRSVPNGLLARAFFVDSRKKRAVRHRAYSPFDALRAIC